MSAKHPNPPGLDALTYRVVTQPAAKRAMLRALGARPALAGLTTRDDDDPVVALADAWAAALDVLVFYQERIADEGFLRTATERRSVLELARATGYELRPGVAASTWLSFGVTAPPGAPDTFPVPVGTRVQSVPGPDELPQAFETVEAIEGRPAWNAVPVAAATERAPAPGDPVVRLARTDLALQAGDALLILAGGPSPWWDLRRVRQATVVPAVAPTPNDPDPVVPAHTLVTLDAPLVAHTLQAAAAVLVSGVEVHAIHQRAAIFGYNAQAWDALPVALRVGEFNPENAGVVLAGAYKTRQTSWVDATFPAGTTTVYLDQVYPKVVAGTWAVFEREGARTVVRVAGVAEVPHADFGLAARTTRLDLSAGNVGGFSPRTTHVLVQSEQLALAPWPITAPLAATDTIPLSRAVPDPGRGRSVVVAGPDDAGVSGAEVAVVRSTDPIEGLVRTLRLEAPLTGSYTRSSARVLLNVARATHGESRAEVLGSGDQQVPFQRFTLHQQPLTYTTAPTPSGTRSTLAVWVGGVRWREVATLHGQRPDARVYVTRRADDGTLSVTFGDGRTGARLPTGEDNVVATYRVGIGRGALLAPGRLTLPLTRPLGLQDVSNPLPADGADDTEPLDRARRNAPLAVRTLGRIVSRADYEDFARAYVGVGKARADVLWDGQRRLVHLTVAGPGGAALATATRQALLEAIDGARHATTPVLVAGHVAKTFALRARLVVEADRRPDDVVAAATAATLARWSFDAQELARSVHAAEVVAALQAVAGVVAVILEAFHLSESAPSREERVPSLPARRSGAARLPAELLTVDPTALSLYGGFA